MDRKHYAISLIVILLTNHDQRTKFSHSTLDRAVRHVL